MTVGFPILKAYQTDGLSTAMLNTSLRNLTGFDAYQGKLIDPKTGVIMAIVLLVESTIGAKLANRSGANRMLKKMTGGMVKLF